MGTCVFCGLEGRMTAEHVFPRWLYDAQPPGSGGVVSTVEQGSSNEEFTTTQWEGTGYDWTVRAVCATCNNGWLSRMEGRVKPVLTPMIQGQSMRLNANTRRLLAAWAVKTVVVSHAKEARSRVPSDHYRQLREGAVAPTGTSVWIAAVDPGPARLVSLRHYDVSLVAPTAGTRYGAYCGTISVGHVVLQVLGHDGSHEIARVLTKNAAAVLHTIWPPPAHTTTWPTGGRVDLAGLSALADDMLTPGVLLLRRSGIS